MTLKVLILLLIFLSLGRTFETQIFNPELIYTENLENLGPSTIHSLKGTLFEEKHKKYANPQTFREDVTLSPIKELHSTTPMTNIKTQNTEEYVKTRQNTFNEYERRNKKNNSDNPNERLLLKDDKLQESSKNLSNSVPLENRKKLKESQIASDQYIPIITLPKMQFVTEKELFDYANNRSVETLRRELSFDSLVIKNEVNNMMDIDPESNKLFNTYPQDEETRRGLNTYPYYAPIQPIAFTTPIRDSDTIPITPKFDNADYNTNRLININKDTEIPIKQKNYNEDKSGCDNNESDEVLDRAGNKVQFKEPTKGHGISDVNSRIMLMDHPRVCYACSSTNDPSCWSPGRSTSVKYCRSDHTSCLTKLYKFKGLSYTIRDCGKECDRESASEGASKFTSCTICHHDLCNGSYVFNIQNSIVLMISMFHLIQNMILR